MKMKNLFILLAVSVILPCILGSGVYAAETEVYVTVANGSLALTRECVSLTDIDGDGVLSINDALYLAHEAKYPGGAEAGYGYEMGDYGLCITRLWGEENGSGYSYYINNAPAMGLADPVSAGDYVSAFVYTDTANYSDTYCFFDRGSVTAAAGTDFTLTLCSTGYDENWTPVTAPVAGAKVLIDGAESGQITDADGRVTISASAGTHIISASSDRLLLVPPVCVADITPAAPQTSDIGLTVILTVTALSVIAAALLTVRRSIRNEK